MASLRVAIIGVGNCATSLIQGVEFYKDAKAGDTVPGLMHVQFGDYHISDIEFVAAFDVDAKKVGKELVEATKASENNTIKICDVPEDGHHGAARPHARRPRQVLPRDHHRVRRGARGHRPGPQGHQGRRAGLATCPWARKRRTSTTPSARSTPRWRSSTPCPCSSRPTPSGPRSSRTPASRSSATTSSPRWARPSRTA